MKSGAATAAVSIACLLVIGSGSSALAATDASPRTWVTEKTRHIPSQFLETSGQAPETAEQRAQAKLDFVDQQMRSGRLVDAQATKSAVVDDVATTWEKGLVVDDIRVDSATQGPDGAGELVAQGLAVVAHPDGTQGARGAANSLGMSGAFGISNATFQLGWCVTTTSGTDNKLTSCFQQYKLNTATKTRDFYYYNRFATAEGHARRFNTDWVPTRIDVRSRPWRGFESRVAALVDYWPKAGVKACDDHSITVGYGSFSGTMPIQDCEEVNPSPGGTSRSMMVVYDQGAIFGGRVHGTDMSYVFSTHKKENPIIADYSYAKYCLNTYLTCDGVLRKDSGW